MTIETLISLNARFSNMIFSGQKTLEIRRRKPSLPSGTRIWIYEKTPVAQIVGWFSLGGIISGNPANFWGDFGARTGITSEEFFAYSTGSKCIHGLVVEEPKRIENRISLEEIRAYNKTFHPPQFFSKLTPGVAPLSLLQPATP